MLQKAECHAEDQWTEDKTFSKHSEQLGVQKSETTSRNGLILQIYNIIKINN